MQMNWVNQMHFEFTLGMGGNSRKQNLGNVVKGVGAPSGREIKPMWTPHAFVVLYISYSMERACVFLSYLLRYFLFV